MTKVEAITNVLNDNGGIATWNIIYNQIEKYYPNIKSSREWKAGIRGVLYRDLGKSFKMLDNGIIGLINYNEENLILQETKQTVGTVLMKVRLGQEKFRKELLKHLKFCPISGIDDKLILIASHIKPWAMANDKERLDINNGFLFCPNIDHLFDRGLISFENDKRILISPLLSQKSIDKVGLVRGEKYYKLPLDERLNYLNYHRENIFVAS